MALVYLIIVIIMIFLGIKLLKWLDKKFTKIDREATLSVISDKMVTLETEEEAAIRIAEFISG